MPPVVRTCLALALTGVLSSGCAAGYLRVSLPAASRAEAKARGDGLPPSPLPYFMGTTFDALCVVLPVLQDPATDPSLKVMVGDWAMLAPFCFLDLPLSTTLDVLLLPVDAWSHQRYARAKRARRSPTKAPDGASSSRDPEG